MSMDPKAGSVIWMDPAVENLGRVYDPSGSSDINWGRICDPCGSRDKNLGRVYDPSGSSDINWGADLWSLWIPLENWIQMDPSTVL